MNVKHILSRKGRDVHTIEPTAPLAAAIKLLAKWRIGALIVTDAGGRMAGIISERDIVRALDEKGTKVLRSPVADIMTRKVVTCTDTVTVVELMERMTRGKFRHVPVAKRGGLAGIVSMGDVVAMRLEELENKLMNVEAITASIAHEVRQPLAAIATNGGAALRFLNNVPPNYNAIQTALHRIIGDCHRTSEVFESIRALFRSVDQEKQPIDVNEIILGVLKSLNGELKDHGVTTRPELTSELPLVEGHRGQLQEVIFNLVQNALEALDTTTNRSRVLRVRTELHGRHKIRVAVEDSGPGIDPKQLDRLFDAFVTTKAHGMGLGLAICRMIIERHGGQLSANSDGKSGTVFQFVLPTEFTDKTTVRAKQVSAPRPKRGRRAGYQGSSP
jgi:signal transduction histidine kinase